MNTLLRVIAGTLIVVIGMLFALPYIVVWDRYRGLFEEEASRMIGREVRVGGKVSLRILPAPYFSADRVRVADTTAVTGEPFFKADQFRIWLSIAPLLRGVVEARDIEIVHPVLTVVVDKEGRGSWRGLSQGTEASKFLPRDLSLQAVRIVDGTLAVHGETGVERMRIGNISGDFTAPALEGPYRAKLAFGGDGRPVRELRLSTGKPEPDGSIRFKASLREAARDLTIAIDGAARDLVGNAVAEGEITAKIGTTERTEARPANAQGLELKSKFKSDLKATKLSDLTLDIDQEGRPQSLTGSSLINWERAPEITTTLAARWLDLDKLTLGHTHGGGAQSTTTPLAVLIDAARFGEFFVTGKSKASTTLKVDQVTVGGDTAGALRLAVISVDGTTRIDELSGALPGGTRVDFNGQASGEGDRSRIEGDLILRGASLSRFVAWYAAGRATPLPIAADGAFGLRGKIRLEPTALTIRDGVAQFGDTNIAIDTAYAWGAEPSLRLTVDGAVIDARPWLPERFGLPAIKAFLVAPSDTRSLDMTVNARVGRLITRDRTYRDVEAAFDLTSPRLRLNGLSFKTEDGAFLEVEGEIADPRTAPKGVLRGVVTAESTAAIETLGTVLDMPAEAMPSSGASALLVPVRMAGSLTIGAHAPNSRHIAFDGQARESRIAGELRLDGGGTNWRDQPADLDLRISGKDAPAVLRLVGLDAGATKSSTADTINVRFAGVPAQGLAGIARIEGPDLAVAFDGRLILAKDAQPQVSATLAVNATDGAGLTSLLPGLPTLGLVGRTVSGTARISLKAGAYEFDRINLAVGGARIDGRLDLSSPIDGRRTINATLAIPTATASGLLAPALEDRPSAVRAAAALISRPEPWPDQPFDLTRLEPLDGEIKLTIGRLLIGEDAALTNTRLLIGLDSGRIELRDVTGEAFGGTWSGALRLERANPVAARSDVTASGLLRFAGGRFPQPARPSAADAGEQAVETNFGPVGGVVTFTGRSLTPRGLMAALAGSGSVDIGGSTLRHLTPAGLDTAIEAGLKAEPSAMIATLRRQIDDRRGTGEVAFGGTRWPLELAEGALRLKPIEIVMGEGKIAAALRIDLTTFQADGEWRVTPTPLQLAPDSRVNPQLPPITFTYGGAAAQIGALTARANSDLLERELTVRKLERDAEDLERLRKQDEERARLDTERRRAEAAARQAQEDQRLRELSQDQDKRRDIERDKEKADSEQRKAALAGDQKSPPNSDVKSNSPDGSTPITTPTAPAGATAGVARAQSDPAVTPTGTPATPGPELKSNAAPRNRSQSDAVPAKVEPGFRPVSPRERDRMFNNGGG